MRPRARSRRESIALRLPVAVLEYPFEVFVAVYGLLASFAVLFAHAVPPSLSSLVPAYVVGAWGVSLGLGGGTVGVGLLIKRALTVAAGLRLVAVALFAYVVGFVALSWSASAIPGALLVGLIIALAGFRSFHLRTATSMILRAEREE